MPIMDIHSHSFYSNCGRDSMESIIEAAIAGGVEVFGISDHNYGIGDRIEQYREDIEQLRKRYAGQIRLLTGIELCTVLNLGFHQPERLRGFDYCLMEQLDRPDSEVGMEVFTYRRKFACRFGLAHTDLIGFARSRGEDPTAFLRRFAQADIFWEINVNYDSIHGWREHPYVQRFVQDEQEQEIVRNSGILLSVGFDGHRVEDYCPDRVIAMSRFLDKIGIPMINFE